MSREYGRIPAVIARSACDEAIQSLLVALDCFASLAMTALEHIALSTVIVRLDRPIQYPEARTMESRTRGVLDPPVKPGDDGFPAMTALMGLTAADNLLAAKLKSEQFATIPLLQITSDRATHTRFDVT